MKPSLMVALVVVLLVSVACATTPSATSEPPPIERQVFGWVTFVESGPERYSLDVDEAQFFTGAEAAAAAAEDGAESPPPNDYYIRNRDSALTRYQLDPTALVTLTGESVGVGSGITTFSAVLADWAAWTAGEGTPEGWNWYGQGLLPYWLTVEGELVVGVEEQYLP